MKRLLILLVLIPSWASAATYYVDCNANGDAGAGTSTAANVAWKTIAKVNASSFSAGDSVLFNKGCTWRETLTVPSSGSAGSPITFGAYGTGAAPIISGGDVITPGTSWTGSTPSTSNGDLVSDNWDDNNTTGWTVAGTGVAAQNQRLEVAFTGTGNHSASQDAASTATEMWLSYNWYVTSVAVEASQQLRGSGIATSVAGAGMLAFLGISEVSGVMKYNWTWQNDASADTTTNLTQTVTTGALLPVLIHWKASTGAGANNGIVQIWLNGAQLVNVSNLDNDTKTAKAAWMGDRWSTGAATSVSQYYDDVKLGTAVVYSGPTWTAAVTTEPTRARMNGTMGTLKANAGAVAAEFDWFWAANVLTIYSVTDPDTAYTTPGVEVSQRIYGIDLNDADYLTIDGLTFEMMGLGWPGGAIADSGSNITGVTIQNNEIRYCGTGIYFYSGTGGDVLVYNNTIHDNASSAVGSGIFSGTVGHEIVIRGNTVYNNLNDGIHVRGNRWIVEQNTVHDNGSTTAGPYIGIHVYTAEDNSEGVGTYNVIRRNVIYNQKGNGEDGSGIETDVYTHHNDIYYNLCFNNDGPGIDIYNSHDVNLWNNVAYGNMQDSAASHAAGTFSEIKLSSSGLDLTATVVVKNNVGFATKAGAFGIYVDAATANNAGLSITNNDWYRASGNWYSWSGTPGATLATWNALDAAIGTDLNADPLFLSATDFRLREGSPAINTGVDLSLTRDFVGTPIMGALPEIGAYEIPGLRFPSTAVKITVAGNVVQFDNRH